MRFRTIYDKATIPTKISFDVKEANQVLIVSGSMYHKVADRMAQVDIFIGKVLQDSITMFQNDQARHLAFPTLFLPLKLNKTSDILHILSFEPTPGTTSDASDRFSVHLLEYS